jgi:hypothetical protein
MHKKIYKPLFTLLACLMTVTLWAQAAGDTSKVEMADQFRANGKIYVVIAVLVTILLGLFVYVIRLDKKISRLEKDFNK